GNATGFENRADAHRNCLMRHVFLTEEAASGVAPRDGVQRDHSGTAMASGTGFVETDVPGAANAQDLQINTAGPANELLVPRAVIVCVIGTKRAVRDMDVLGRNVHMVE